jgi:hyperosmotically inducible periplasmic protein
MATLLPKEILMKSAVVPTAFFVCMAFASFSGCSNSEKSPDLTGQIRSSLDQAGLTDVNVSQDRIKGVVTLSGTTSSEDRRDQAESIAKGFAGNQVVSDQISVRPPGNESAAKTVDSDLDKAIEKNYDAVLVQHRLKKDVKYDVQNGVITLSGDVRSEAERQQAEKLAHQVPNVRQVVNELEIKKGNQKATSS